jgi:enamine deaminase RidA (YjgF/YER057c/UK114 family)
MIETLILAKPGGRASIVATAMKSAVAKEAQRRAGRQAFEGLTTKALTRPELLDRGHPSAGRPAAEACAAAGGGDDPRVRGGPDSGAEGDDMARKVLTPTGTGKPIGMYSAGFTVDPARLVFLAGQVAMDVQGRVVGEGDLKAQATQVYANPAAVLAEAGCTLRDVVKFTTYVVQNQDRASLAEWRREEYPKLFPDGVYPADTGVVVAELAHPSLLPEVEAIAVQPERPPAPARGARRAAPAGGAHDATRTAGAVVVRVKTSLGPRGRRTAGTRGASNFSKGRTGNGARPHRQVLDAGACSRRSRRHAVRRAPLYGGNRWDNTWQMARTRETAVPASQRSPRRPSTGQWRGAPP